MQSIIEWLNLGKIRPDQLYMIVGIACFCLIVYCIFLGVSNRIVFYRNKADMLLSFMAWVLVGIFAWVAMMPENKELFQNLCMVIICVSIFYNVFMALKYNPAFWLLAIPIGISRAILGLLFIATWVELLFGNTNRRRSKTIQTGILAGVLTTLVYSLVNGDEVFECRESQSGNSNERNGNTITKVIIVVVVFVILGSLFIGKQIKQIIAPPIKSKSETTTTSIISTTTNTIPKNITTIAITTSTIPTTTTTTESRAITTTLLFKPSFDCSKASNFAELTICDNDYLGNLDGLMSMNYSALLSADIGDEARDDLKKTQRKWLAERNKCRNSDCLIKSYKDRLETICGDYPVISGVHPCYIPDGVLP